MPDCVVTRRGAPPRVALRNNHRACLLRVAAALLLALAIGPATVALGQTSRPAESLPSTPPIDVEFDRNAPFPRYRSFAWAPDLEPLKNSTNHRLLVSAVERVLGAKGMTKASPGQPPDVLVSFYAKPVGKLKAQTAERSAATRDPSTQSIVTTMERERLGTLAIELIDGISRHTVWRAMGTQMLGSQTETAEQVDGYAAALLASYPPDPSKP